ncbi:MAG: FTR1 family protein [Chloroflexota bacterium]|nr:FTR1 family protein [Chloroflexota bacterium]
MDIGFLTTGLLTGLREGVESALIVSIILAYLARTGNTRHFGRIWVGAGAALAVSAAVGALLWISIGGLKAPAEQYFEGTAMLLAAGVVTWMLFWMRRTAANIKGELQAGVDRALTDGSVWALSILAFTAVVREGIETSLFLLGQATAATTEHAGAAGTLVGALIGILIAALLGYGFYRGARVINLARFFRWTGVALVFIAGGLVSHAAHEFIEAGLIGVGTAIAFDLSRVLSDTPEGGHLLGQLLRAVFGYSATPEWTTLLTWVAYVVSVLALYLRPMKPRSPAPISSSQPAPGA